MNSADGKTGMPSDASVGHGNSRGRPRLLRWLDLRRRLTSGLLRIRRFGEGQRDLRQHRPGGAEPGGAENDQQDHGDVTHVDSIRLS